MTRVAIIQPNYIPWKGYFDIIHQVDIFVFLDDVQYTSRDWRNRNRIKMPSGDAVWLTVPVAGDRNQRICDAEIDNTRLWQRKHCEALRHSYGKSPFFNQYFPPFAERLAQPWKLLAELDIALTSLACDWLSLRRTFYRSSELGASGSKDDRLINLVRKVGGDHYLSGPAAKDYIRPERFAESGIGLSYHDYGGFPEYPQISAPFDHFVTILDLLFSVGPEAPEYIWGQRRHRHP